MSAERGSPEELLDVASVVFHVRPVRADKSGSCIPAMLAYLSSWFRFFCRGGRKRSPPTNLQGRMAEFDTLNLISASPPFARCRNMMAGGNGLRLTHHDRGRLAQMAVSGVCPEVPSLSTRAGAVTGTSSRSFQPPSDKHAGSSQRHQQAGPGRCSKWLTLAKLDRDGGVRETGLVPGEPGFGAQSSPQPHLGSAHKAWPCSPMEQEAPYQPVRAGRRWGAMRTSAAARSFPGIPPAVFCESAHQPREHARTQISGTCVAHSPVRGWHFLMFSRPVLV